MDEKSYQAGCSFYTWSRHQHVSFSAREEVVEYVKKNVPGQYSTVDFINGFLAMWKMYNDIDNIS